MDSYWQHLCLSLNNNGVSVLIISVLACSCCFLCNLLTLYSMALMSPCKRQLINFLDDDDDDDSSWFQSLKTLIK